jgi:prefoldin subunit 5
VSTVSNEEKNTGAKRAAAQRLRYIKERLQEIQKEAEALRAERATLRDAREQQPKSGSED